MFKILYLYKKSDPMTPFVDRQIRQAELDGNILAFSNIEDIPSKIEEYNLTYNHTIVIQSVKTGKEVHRIEGLFTDSDLSMAIRTVKDRAVKVS